MKPYANTEEAGVEGADDPTAAVAPLIDVSFLLLIYFLVTTTLLQDERDLSMQSAPKDSERATVSEAMVIEIRADDSVVLNPGEWEMVLSQDASDRHLSDLQSQLALMQSVAGSQGPLIVLRAMGEARQQRVVDVLNCLSGSGVQRVSFVDEFERLREVD